jgi:hypothetical protein
MKIIPPPVRGEVLSHIDDQRTKFGPPRRPKPRELIYSNRIYVGELQRSRSTRVALFAYVSNDVRGVQIQQYFFKRKWQYWLTTRRRITIPILAHPDSTEETSEFFKDFVALLQKAEVIARDMAMYDEDNVLYKGDPHEVDENTIL